MKTIFVIPLHSCSALITNSSSEIWVCNSGKSVEATKEILTKLLAMVTTRSFEECFREPYIEPVGYHNDDFDFTVEKGNLVIESESDNTVPWEMFDMIDSIFSGSHYHLG